MARPLTTSRDDWLMAGFQTLVDDGPSVVTAEGVARTLGVTKGGFYGTFGSLAQFHSAIAGAWADHAVEQALQSYDALPGPRDRIMAFIDAVSARDAAPWGGANAEAAMRAWAVIDPEIANAFIAADQRRVDWLAAILDEMGLPDHAAEIFYAGYLGVVVVDTMTVSDKMAHLRQLLEWIPGDQRRTTQANLRRMFSS